MTKKKTKKKKTVQKKKVEPKDLVDLFRENLQLMQSSISIIEDNTKNKLEESKDFILNSDQYYEEDDRAFRYLREVVDTLRHCLTENNSEFSKIKANMQIILQLLHEKKVKGFENLEHFEEKSSHL